MEGMERISLSNALFSGVQRRVLGLIFGNPDRSFYTSEIVRSVRSGKGAVERELTRLRQSGLVTVARIGNQTHYQANPSSPIFGELRGLVRKTVGLADPLREALAPVAGQIRVAFVFGSVAKESDTAASDIDLMIVGDELNYSDLYTATQEAENKIGRKVSPVFLTPQDWTRKASDKGSFVNKVAAGPKIFIMGTEKNLSAWESRSSTIS